MTARVMVRPGRSYRSGPNGGENPRSSVSLLIRTGRGLVVPRAAILIVVVAFLPIVMSGAGGYEARYVLAISGSYAIATLGGNLIAATARDINLAMGAQMAVGGYATAYAETHHWGTPVAVVLAIGASTVVSFVVSLGVVKLREVYTALATFALAFCIPDLATYLHPVTGGGSGEYMLPIQIGGLSLGGGSLDLDYAVMILFGLFGTIWLVFMDTGAGRRMLMLDDAEPALAGLGRSPYWMKVRIWTVSGLVAGLAGLTYGLTVGYLNPQQFTYFLSLQLFVGGVVGGLTSVMGALIGGLLVGGVPIYLSNTQGGVEDIFFGTVLVLALLLGKSGLWPRIEDLMYRSYRRIRGERT